MAKQDETGIERYDVSVPGDTNNTKLAFVLENVLTIEECEELIRLTEEKGYVEALVNVGGGRQISLPDVRNSYRCIWDSVEKADWLWERIKEHIPKEWNGHKVLGLNERLRFLRYDGGQYFKPHFDGSFIRDNGEISFITIHLYLNEGYEGGCTTFIGREEDYPIPVKTGMVLVFEHRILHEGSMLKNGRKYTMRTDVMYQR